MDRAVLFAICRKQGHKIQSMAQKQVLSGKEYVITTFIVACTQCGYTREQLNNIRKSPTKKEKPNESASQ